MAACVFFGHRECHNMDSRALAAAIEALIKKGVDTFYVGNQGQFDGIVYSLLKQFREKYPHIRICVVLAYLPEKQGDVPADSMYPEIEGHPKFAIARRNRWMVDASDYCICWIDHPWGGAWKFAKLARRRGKMVINLGKVTDLPRWNFQADM